MALETFNLLDFCLHNVFVLYKVNTNNNKMHFIDFRMDVAKKLLQMHRPQRVRCTSGRPSSLTPSDTNPLHLVGKLLACIRITCGIQIQFQLITFYCQYPKLKHRELTLGGDVMYVCIHNMVGRKEKTLNIRV